jgi:hypothetical protein
MTETKTYSWTVVARRFVARTTHHLFRHPFIFLGMTAVVAFLVLGGPSLIPASQPTASASSDAADQYMRGMRDHDVTAVFSSLSPDMQHSLEQRTGAVGPAAVAAVFREQDKQGEKTTGYQLVASYQTVQGDEVRFYIVHDQHGDEQRDIPYLLTLSQDGTVDNVE